MTALANGPALQVVGGPEPVAAPLADVSEAYAYLEQCRERESRAKCILVETIRDARVAGESVRAIAAAMGVTRQYVQKVIREADRGAELEAEAMAAETRALEREGRERLSGLGFTTRDRQCQVKTCRRLKSRPSDVCGFCGDDPVTHNGSAQDYDAAYAGGVR